MRKVFWTPIFFASMLTLAAGKVPPPRQDADRIPVSVPAEAAGGAAAGAAWSDLDGDGVKDLAAGYILPGGGGIIAIHPGAGAFAMPHDPAFAGQDSASPFGPATHVIRTAVRPEFVFAGDFDGDALPDLVTSARGATSLHFILDAGSPRSSNERTLSLGGVLTALAAGEINRPDGLTDIVAALAVRDGGQIAVWEHPNGVLAAEEERTDLDAAPDQLALGDWDGDGWRDWVAAKGQALFTGAGRDRMLSLDPARNKPAPKAPARRSDLPSAVLSLHSDPSGIKVTVRTAEGTPRPLGQGAAEARFGLGAGQPAAEEQGLPADLNFDVQGDMILAQGGGFVAVIPRPMSTFTVNSNADPGDGTCDGTCTLRDAILAANAAGGADTINFSFGTTTTIAPASALPAITSPVTIDATTISGYASTPLLVLDGNGAGVGAIGLQVTGVAYTFKGINIQRFDNHGIYVTGAGATGGSIVGCVIGTDAVASTARANNGHGIYLVDTGTATIGGTTAALRNILSGNTGSGIRIDGCTGITLLNNYIGTNQAGSATIGNSDRGVWVQGGTGNASSIAIGGTSASNGNLICGNGTLGIILTTGSSGTNVYGNKIGMDAGGTVDLGNVLDGIYIFESTNNNIGGTTTAHRNFISGNNGDGIEIDGSNLTSGNQIQGNVIGLTSAISNALGNTQKGVFLNDANGLTVGGTASGAGNYVSSNLGWGVYIEGRSGGGIGNNVQGNIIGLNSSNADRGNTTDGVIIDAATDNLIGGTTAGARNVISGNNRHGVALVFTTGFTNPSDNVISGNYIGLTAPGTGLIANTGSGVYCEGQTNTIGGTTSASTNYIAGNGDRSIRIFGENANGNIISANRLGFLTTGANALSLKEQVLIDGATNTQIGGATTAEGNVISNAQLDGIRIQSNGLATGTGTTVRNNYIGTNIAGSAAAPNGYGGTGGVGIRVLTTPNTIGANGAGNLISGNAGGGILVSGVTGITIKGNRIGTNLAGSAAVANGGNPGITINSAPSTVVGTATSGDGNHLAGDDTGIYVTASNNVSIAGNLFGTNAAGTAPIAAISTFAIFSDSNNTVINSNVIGNADYGVYLLGGSGYSVTGNTFGMDAAGANALPFLTLGLYLEATTSATVGAAGAGNTFGNAGGPGIYLFDAASTTIKNNVFGSNAAVSVDFGNGGAGLEVDSTSNCVVGDATYPNIFIHNAEGINAITSGTGNQFAYNSFRGNDGLAIDLDGTADAVDTNDNLDPDTGTNNRQNYPVLTNAFSDGVTSTIEGDFNSLASSDFTLHFYRSTTCDGSGYGEGLVHMGSQDVNTDGSGDAPFVIALGAGASSSEYITAVAVNVLTGDTSEFSDCEIVTPPPADMGTITWTAGMKTQLEWAAVPGSSGYRVYRGYLANLPDLLDGDYDSCRIWAGTTLNTGPVLTELPAPGTFVWYIGRARNTAGESPAGYSSFGPRILNSTGLCP